MACVRREQEPLLVAVLVDSADPTCAAECAAAFAMDACMRWGRGARVRFKGCCASCSACKASAAQRRPGVRSILCRCIRR
jgi:hypothetical protein